jgi:hypothetical protein
MRGTLSVESEPGVGSAFTLRVPVRVLDAHEKAVVLAAAEANAAALQAAEQQLAERHAAVAVAPTPQSGEKRPRKARSRRFNVLVAVRSRSCGWLHARAFHYDSLTHTLMQDDHPLNLRLITRLLQLQDFDVTPVADGGAAFDALRTSYGTADAAAAPFDIAILDMSVRGQRAGGDCARRS